MIKAYFNIIRPVNCFITVIGALTIFVISRQGALCQIIFTTLSAAMIAAGGNVINDIFDVEIDRINRPARPLPAGQISIKSAYIYYAMLNSLALIMAMLINAAAALIAVFTIIGLCLYSKYLKKMALIGNLLISFLTGMVFIYAAAATGLFEPALFPALFAFTINLAREIIKDIEDIDGDKKLAAGTLPIKHGIVLSIRLIRLALISTLLLISMAAALGIYKAAFAIICVLAILPIITHVFWRLNKNCKGKDFRLFGNLLKVCMLIGIVAILSGSV